MVAKSPHTETFFPTTLRLKVITGGAAGNHTVTGIGKNDILKSVLQISPTTETEKEVVIQLAVEDLAANADITERGFFRVPAAMNGLVIQDVWIVSRAAPAGIDASNTCVVTVTKVGTGNIASETFDATPAFPAANVAADLGTITNGTLSTGDILGIVVTNGTTADPPAFDVVISAKLSASGAIGAADLTSEFSISADNTIENAGGTATTSDVLLVIYDVKPLNLDTI